MDAPRRAISAGDALLILAAVVSAAIATSLLLQPAGLLATQVGTQLVVLPVVAAVMRARGLPGTAVGLRPLSWRGRTLSAAGAAAVALAGAHFYVIQVRTLESLGLDFEDAAKGFEKVIKEMIDQSLAATLVSATILAPLIEELLFRGVLLRGFETAFGKARALLYSSLLFGAVHAIVPRIGVTFLVGLYLGAIVLRTGSLWAGVIAHVVYNLIAVSLGDLPRFNPWLLLAGTIATLVALRLAPPGSRPAGDPA